MRVFRHNLSGGALGADLHYRSDLESYHKSNLVQNSFLPTPYGGVIRRPASELMFTLGTVTVDDVVYSPAAVVCFDFVYSRSEMYTVALVSYAASGHDSFSRFLILTLAGTLKDTLDCDYQAEHFNELYPRQVNDVMYIAHNDYPFANLVRNGDTDWTLEEIEMKGGPWLPWNSDDTTIFFEKAAWSSAVTYQTGDIIHSGVSDISITGAAYVFWKPYTGTTTYWGSRMFIRITVASHSFAVGGIVKVSGFSGDASIINGTWAVQAVGTTYFDINIGSYNNQNGEYNMPALPLTFANEKVGNNAGDQFYVSMVDGNTNHALPTSPAIESIYWRKTAAVDTVVCHSTDDLFTADHVGQKIYASVNIAQTISQVFINAYNPKNSTTWAGSVSDPIAYSNGVITLRTEGGVWGGILALQQSVDGGVTWETIGVINGGGGNHNGEITRDIAEPEVVLRVLMETYEEVTSGTNCKWQLEFPQGTPFIGIIDEYTDERTVVVRCETAITKLFQTKNWKLGAFSAANGYPGVVTIHDERLVLGGSKLQPFMAWCSAVNNWDWFADGTLVTSPLMLQANADRATRFCWMLSKGELLFGTDFDEYSAGSRDSDTVMSGINPPKIQVQNSYSSAPKKALSIGEDIIFVQSDGKTLRSMSFSDAKWGYAGMNMTISNPEIAGSGFRWLAVQKNPFPVIWAGTEDDTLISFTYDKEMNIMGWANHTLAGATVIAGCVMPTTGTDTIVICTKRGTVFHLEKMRYDNLVSTDNAGGTDAVMTSLMQPTSMAQAPNVLEEARYRVTKVFLYLKASQGGEVSVDEGVTWTAIPYDSNALFTGKKQIAVNSGNCERAPLQIRTTGTKPFNLLAIGMDIDKQSTKE